MSAVVFCFNSLIRKSTSSSTCVGPLTGVEGYTLGVRADPVLEAPGIVTVDNINTATRIHEPKLNARSVVLR